MKIYIMSKRLNYSVSQDPKQMMADFYMLSSIDAILRSNKTLSHKIDVDVKYSIEQISAELVEASRQRLLEDVFIAICSEADHLLNSYSFTPSGLNNEQRIFFNNLKEFEKNGITEEIPRGLYFNKDLDDLAEEVYSQEVAELISFIFLKSGSEAEAIKKIKSFFAMKKNWSDLFGGENWVRICDAWLNLYNAKTIEQKVSAIDRIYDLEHNSGNVLDKLSSYERANIDGEMSHDWVKSMLDYKFAILTLWGLYDLCSPSCKIVVAPLIRKIEGASYDDFRSGKIENIISPEILEEDGRNISSHIAYGAIVDLMGGEYPPLESEMSKHPITYIQYLTKIRKKDLEFEKTFYKEAIGYGEEYDIAIFMLQYCIAVNAKSEYFEEHIFKYYKLALKYIEKFGRNENYERYIISNVMSDGEQFVKDYAIPYIAKFIKDRWIEIEPYIYTCSYGTILKYISATNINIRSKEAEDILAKNSINNKNLKNLLNYLTSILGINPLSNKKYIAEILTRNDVPADIAEKIVEYHLK